MGLLILALGITPVSYTHLGLRDPFITAQDHGWKDCHTGDHAEDDTFYHNHTDVDVYKRQALLQP